MPKFNVTVILKAVYDIVVEAPSQAAAERFQRNLDSDDLENFYPTTCDIEPGNLIELTGEAPEVEAVVEDSGNWYLKEGQ